MNILLNTMAIFLIAATLAPSLPSKHWLVRVWEFPRLQLLGLMVIVLITQGVMYPSSLSVFNTLITALLYIGLIACAIYQAIWILPYTFFYKKEVVKASSQDAGESISILSSNVFMPNEDYDKLLKHVRDTNPDFVVTLESNKSWEIALSTLNETHPHQQRCPLENLYGMHLYSKYPLKTAKLNYLVEDDVPSMLVTIDMDGQDVTLYFLHPKPPSPTENKTAKPRDVELTMVGQEIAKKDGPIIVAGDLNDVAWSPTTRKFKRISGMLDPRIGRAFFNTFHAHYPLVKWPLDHVFHSNHFMLEDIRKLPDIGSDHYPLLTRLKLKPKA